MNRVLMSAMLFCVASVAVASFGTSQDVRQILRDQRQIQEQVEDPMSK